jgi:hydrogenase-4 component B
MIQTAFNSFLILLLVAPVVTLISPAHKKLRLAGPVLLLIVLALGTAIAGVCFWQGRTVAIDLSSLAPLPFALAVDRLSAFFLLLICGVGLPVTLFSISYVERHYEAKQSSWIWVLMPLFLASMVLVVAASTTFAFLFGWELMTLLSAGLILIDGDSEQRRHNVSIYLLMMHAGAAAVVGAFMVFMSHGNALSFAGIRAAAAVMPPELRSIVFVFAFVGFGAKAGIIPLHLWLPRAHPIAPTPVSALMSGIMLKTAIYGFVRFSFDFLGAGPSWWGYAALVAGAASGVLGVLYAISEHDLKRLLAYHSVENIGIIYLGLGAALVFRANNAPLWATLALMAALLHSLNHALFKSLLFLGAGAISDATHTLNIEELGGLLTRMKMTGALFLIACCSIVGLPLFNGFISEWLTFRSFIAGGALASPPAAILLPLGAGVLALIGGLAAACFAKVYGVAFLGRPRSAEAEQAREVPRAMLGGMSVLAVACVIIGIAPRFVLSPLAVTAQGFLGGAGLPEEAASITRLIPWIAALVLAVPVGAGFLRIKRRITPTWACGLPGLDARMQYTSTSFSKPLRRVFSRVYRPERSLEVLPADETFFPTSIEYRSVRTTSYEKALYRPAVDAIVATANRLRQLQTGNIQVYLLYMFLALVALLIFMRLA